MTRSQFTSAVSEQVAAFLNERKPDVIAFGWRLVDSNVSSGVTIRVHFVTYDGRVFADTLPTHEVPEGHRIVRDALNAMWDRVNADRQA